MTGEYDVMKRMKALLVISVTALGLAGCANMNRQQQHMLSGGAIGAAGGAAVAAIAEGNPLVGALIGAGAGTAVGALMDSHH